MGIVFTMDGILESKIIEIVFRYIYKERPTRVRSRLLSLVLFVKSYPKVVEKCKIVFLEDIDKGEREN